MNRYRLMDKNDIVMVGTYKECTKYVQENPVLRWLHYEEICTPRGEQ